jgi:hypothetical protein
MHRVSTPHAGKSPRAVHWRSAARGIFLALCALLLTLVSAVNAHASTTPVGSTAFASAMPHQVSTGAEASHVFQADRSHDRQPTRDSDSQDNDSRDLVDEDLDDLDDDDDGGDPGDPDASALTLCTLPGLLSPSCACTLVQPPGGAALATMYLTDSVRRL